MEQNAMVLISSLPVNSNCLFPAPQILQPSTSTSPLPFNATVLDPFLFSIRPPRFPIIMRFRTELKNIRTFASEFSFLTDACFCVILTVFMDTSNRESLELVAALGSLEKIAWLRLSDDTARFTVIPDMGSQVWAYVFSSVSMTSSLTNIKLTCHGLHL